MRAERDADRIQADIIILHVSTNASLYMSIPYVVQSRSCTLIHHISEEACRIHKLHIHVNANIASAYHSRVQVDNSDRVGTVDIASVSGSAGVNKADGQHMKSMLAVLGCATEEMSKALTEEMSKAPNTEVSSKAKVDVEVVQCDIMKLLKSCQKDLVVQCDIM